MIFGVINIILNLPCKGLILYIFYLGNSSIDVVVPIRNSVAAITGCKALFRTNAELLGSGFACLSQPYRSCPALGARGR